MVRMLSYTGIAREKHTRTGDVLETGMKNVTRKYWKEGNCREQVAS